jgi:hypothetical protein
MRRCRKEESTAIKTTNSTKAFFFIKKSAAGAYSASKQSFRLTEEIRRVANEYRPEFTRREEKCQEKVTHLRERFFLILSMAA